MKDDSILALKGFAIIGVVFHHIANSRFTVDVRNCIEILPAAFSWSVLVFFALSGWLHALGEGRRAKSIVEFTRLRAARLLVPFISLVLVYSLALHALQSIGVENVIERFPSSLGDKVWASIPPTKRGHVAPQLYFLPMLFIVSSVAHGLYRVAGTRGVAGFCILLLVAGMCFFPDADNSGFSWGVGVWGSFSYTLGFFMCQARGDRRLLPSVVVLAVAVCCVTGLAAIAKVAPVFFLGLLGRVNLGRIPLLAEIGEASGTVFAYHTPFVLQPLVILSTKLPTPFLQFGGVVVACVITLFVCVKAFYSLRNSRFSFVAL